MPISRKVILFLFFLVVPVIISFAQDSTRCLIIERLEKGKVDSLYGISLIEKGSIVTVRTTDNLHPQKGKLTNITDTSLVLDFTNMVMIARVTEITWEPPATPKTKRNSGAIIIGGITAAIAGILLIRHSQSLVGLYLTIGAGLIGTIIVGVRSTHTGSNGTVKQKKQFAGHWKMSSVPVSFAKNYERRTQKVRRR
jgi:hypothetical protein